VGSNLARQLVKAGWRVHALVRPDSSLQEIDGLPVVLHQGDLTDRASVMAAMPERPDAVFHVTADTNC